MCCEPGEVRGGGCCRPEPEAGWDETTGSKVVRQQWGEGPAGRLTSAEWGGACSSVKDWTETGAPAEAPRCGPFQLPGDSAPKARKGKHVRCAGAGVERGAVGRRWNDHSFRRSHFRRGGGTLQGAGHPQGPRARAGGGVVLRPRLSRLLSRGLQEHRTLLRQRGPWVSVLPQPIASPPHLPLDWRSR